MENNNSNNSNTEEELKNFKENYKLVELRYNMYHYAVIPKNAENVGDKHGSIYYDVNGETYKKDTDEGVIDYKYAVDCEEYDYLFEEGAEVAEGEKIKKD
mgnify:CR=1 FL=1